MICGFRDEGGGDERGGPKEETVMKLVIRWQAEITGLVYLPYNSVAVEHNYVPYTR